MDIRGLMNPHREPEQPAQRSQPPPQLLLPGRQQQPVIDLTGDSPPHSARNAARRPREVIDVDSLPDRPPRLPAPRLPAPRVEQRRLPPPNTIFPGARAPFIRTAGFPEMIGADMLFHQELERLQHRQQQSMRFAQHFGRPSMHPRTAFQPPGNLAYDRPGAFTKESRPFHETYKAPPAPHKGFTRSPKSSDVLVCSNPDCDKELGDSENEEHQAVWITKCGHPYCGECGSRFSTLAKKRKPSNGANVKCMINHCRQDLRGNKAFIKLRV